MRKIEENIKYFMTNIKEDYRVGMTEDAEILIWKGNSEDNSDLVNIILDDDGSIAISLIPKDRESKRNLLKFYEVDNIDYEEILTIFGNSK